jgi:hypothetical protein
MIVISLLHLLATDVRSEEGRRVYLAATETHDGWFFAAGDEVVIAGTVLGDVYASGGTLRIEGRVVGDLLIAGGQVIVSGEVTDDIRVAGGTLELGGIVGKNISAAGGSVSIAPSGEVRGGALLAGGDVSIAGKVLGSARVAAGSLTMRGNVDHDLRFAGGAFTLAPGARVGGNLTVEVEDTSMVSIDPAAVAGTVSVLTGKGEGETRGSTLGVWFRILWVGSLLLVAVLWILLSPGSLAAVAQRVKSQPGRAGLAGAGAIIGIPIVILILFVTLIGIPAGLALGTLYLWGFYVSAIIVGTALGLAVRRGEDKRALLLAALGGIIVLQLLALIPIIKVLVIAAMLVLGMGAILLAAYAAVRPSRV